MADLGCRRVFAFKTFSFALRATEDRSSCAKARLHPSPSGLFAAPDTECRFRGHTENTEVDMASVCPAFDSRLWIRPEVHKKPEARLRESEVVENLGAMLFAKLVNGLDFDNYLALELLVLHGLDYAISASFRVGSLEPLPCRGHLTPTEGRGGAETLGEGRPGRAVPEKSKGEHCDLQATASTRRLNRRNAARQMRRASVVARKRSNASTAIFRLVWRGVLWTVCF